MTNRSFPSTLSERTLTVYVEGEAYHVSRPEEGQHNPQWERIKEALNNPYTTADEMLALVRPTVAIAQQLNDPAVVEESAGKVTLKDGKLYYDGAEVHSVLTERMVDIIREGIDITPWVRFANNLFQNPEPFSINELFLFLETGDLPITEDGHFLAFKKVRENYKDIHSGTFDNSIGAVCEMPREQVDADRLRECSTGLHFCSKKYLPHFANAHNDRVMMVKINPADVVSIPHDYNNTKGRCWRYEVVGEIPTERAQTHVFPATVEKDWTADVEDDIWNQPEPALDDSEDKVLVTEEQVQEASQSRFRRWLNRNKLRR